MDNIDFRKNEIVTNSKQLTKKQVWLFGSVFILAGLMIILLGLGVIHADPSTVHAPMWIIVCAGLVFLLGGVVVINGYAFSRPNLIISDILGVSVVGIMTLICWWVAFGPGERHFTTTSSFLFSKTTTSGNSEQGRFVFGIAFFLMLIFFIFATIQSIKKYFKK